MYFKLKDLNWIDIDGKYITSTEINIGTNIYLFKIIHKLYNTHVKDVKKETFKLVMIKIVDGGVTYTTIQDNLLSIEQAKEIATTYYSKWVVNYVKNILVLQNDT